MDKFRDMVEGMYDIIEDNDDELAVENGGKRYTIRYYPTGTYDVTGEDGRKKTFLSPETEVLNYIMEDSVGDKRDIFVRNIKRFLLVSLSPRLVCGSFDTREEAQERINELNEWAREEGDVPGKYTVIDCGDGQDPGSNQEES